jgi:Second Messenger Oligonucleotide or Dinucleotide Synthetase domain/Adenylyl/Guanylyl and SMODS C-terminal sensor domain
VKLLAYFDAFLSDVVNLNATRLALLHARVEAIIRSLEKDDVIAPLLQGHIPQGSWAHKTIIRPVEGREFDADFLLTLTEVNAWSDSPKIYLQQLRAAFKRSSTYAAKVRRKNRCVRIGYAGDCHVDVVAHLVLAGGRQVIVNYAEDKFEDTNPQGFTAWMEEKDQLAGGNLRKVIRLMKYIRDFKETFSVPSVILTMLLGERVQAFDRASRYADVPTTLLNLISDLDAWLVIHPDMPLLEDPSCPGTTFNHRWDQDRYENFRRWISYYAARIREAYSEPDKTASITAWQKIFGPEFTQPVTKAAEGAALAMTLEQAREMGPAAREPFEEFIEDKGYALAGGHNIRIECTVARRPGFRDRTPLREMHWVDKGRRLQFRITHCDVPPPYQLWWKVRNTGSEAAAVPGGLRGKLLPDDGTASRVETTSYRGRHYVEAYIVKDGRVVASDHHDVEIR